MKKEIQPETEENPKKRIGVIIRNSDLYISRKDLVLYFMQTIDELYTIKDSETVPNNLSNDVYKTIQNSSDQNKNIDIAIRVLLLLNGELQKIKFSV